MCSPGTRSLGQTVYRRRLSFAPDGVAREPGMQRGRSLRRFDEGCLRKDVYRQESMFVGLLTGSELPGGSVGYWHNRLSRGAN